MEASKGPRPAERKKKAMATKEQERKALEQIRKIIEGLGKDSYIGIAVEGMLEDAAENIENDFALSMKDRFDHQQKINAKLESQLAGIAKDYQQAKNEVELARRTVVDESKRRQEIEARLRETEKVAADRLNEILETKEATREQADQIVRLKAKLYDLMTAEA